AFPNDALGLSGGNTGFSLTYASNVVVGVNAPANDGFNLFQKWQLDGVDYSTNQNITVTMGTNHTLLAVYVPPHDRCAGAIALATAVPYTENTAGATSIGDPTAGCGLGGSNAVWFTYTPSVSGIVTINGCGSDFDTVFEAYSGTCGALTAIQCNDDQG